MARPILPGFSLCCHPNPQSRSRQKRAITSAFWHGPLICARVAAAHCPTVAKGSNRVTDENQTANNIASGRRKDSHSAVMFFAEATLTDLRCRNQFTMQMKAHIHFEPISEAKRDDRCIELSLAPGFPKDEPPPSTTSGSARPFSAT